MAERLAGKVALVSGAGASQPGIGVGKAISVLFAREGAQVALVDKERARAEETLSLIEQDGGDATVVEADATSEADCRRAVDAAVERYGRLDVLVTVVFLAQPAPTALEHATRDDWDHTMAVNLTSAMLMSKFAIPRMREAGGGSIVYISSNAGLQAHGMPAYGAAKAGLILLAKEVALMSGRDGIRANVVCPGHIAAAHMAAKLSDPATLKLRRDIAPLGIEGDPWDIAWASVYFASDESRFVTAQTLAVDGGVTQIAPFAGHFLLNGDPRVASGGGLVDTTP